MPADDNIEGAVIEAMSSKMAEDVNELMTKMNSGEWFVEKAEAFLKALVGFTEREQQWVNVDKIKLAELLSGMYDEGYQAALDHHGISNESGRMEGERMSGG